MEALADNAPDAALAALRQLPPAREEQQQCLQQCGTLPTLPASDGEGAPSSGGGEGEGEAGGVLQAVGAMLAAQAVLLAGWYGCHSRRQRRYAEQAKAWVHAHDGYDTRPVGYGPNSSMPVVT